MLGLLLLLPFLAAPPAVFVAAAGELPVQRYLAHLALGDDLEDIKKIYAPSDPKQEWPSYLEPRGHVTRYRVERASLRVPDPYIETMWLGFKKGGLRLKGPRLVEITLIYDAKHTKDRSVEAMAGELGLIYGEPRRSHNKFWWSDGRTVIRTYYAEVPVLKDGQKAVEFRTCLQLLEEGLFQRVD